MSGGGILTGPQICKEVAAGRITIDPWDPGRVHDEETTWRHRRVNSGSYDLTLGPKVKVYRAVTMFTKHGIPYFDKSSGPVLKTKYASEIATGGEIDLRDPAISTYMTTDPHGVLDAKKPNETWEFDIPEQGWLLKPGVGYLMHTNERVLTEHFTPHIDGKSSVGRLFVTVHVTAGFGDAGFDGQYTLEVVALYPTWVYAGMRFCQIRFETMVGDPLLYGEKGHYVGAASMGPVASMTWKQFEEEEQASGAR